MQIKWKLKIYFTQKIKIKHQTLFKAILNTIGKIYTKMYISEFSFHINKGESIDVSQFKKQKLNIIKLSLHQNSTNYIGVKE